MNWQISVIINENLYLRNPEQSAVGKRILSEGVKMIDRLGLEEFTFRKLAMKLNTNESSIYRYFESKHRLLLYLIQWYWRWMEYKLVFSLQNVHDPVKKIDIILDLLMSVHEPEASEPGELDKQALHRIVVKEASKAYLTRHVQEDNQKQFFKPYKDFNARIAAVILEFNPGYRYARSLSSTVIEMSHYQYFFMNNLPSLTDFGENKSSSALREYLRHLILSAQTAG